MVVYLMQCFVMNQTFKMLYTGCNKQLFVGYGYIQVYMYNIVCLYNIFFIYYIYNIQYIIYVLYIYI